LKKESVVDHQQLDEKFPDPRWKYLYRIGGYTSFLVAALTVIAIAIYFVWPYKPGIASVTDIFATIQTNPFAALMSLDLFDVIIMIITIPLVLAMYVTMKQANESFALIAAVFGLISCVMILTARPIGEMFSLSNQYAAATTDAARLQYLAAGEALSAVFSGTTWMLYIFAFGVWELITSLQMLRSHFFGKKTGYLGLILLLGLGFFIPVIGTALLLVTSLVSTAWFILLSHRFFQLDHSAQVQETMTLSAERAKAPGI
jgi:hypothetical protein